MNAKRWLIVGAGVLLVLVIPASLIVWRLEPRARVEVERLLGARLDSVVTLEALDLGLWPSPSLHGRGLTIRHRGRMDLPPLVSIRSFEGHASWWGLWRRHLWDVTVDGLELTIPPQRRADMPSLSGGDDAGEGKGEAASKEDDEGEDEGPGFAVDVVRAVNARLSIMPRRADKDPRIFDIYSLEILDLTFEQPSSFVASLTNPIPAGLIETTGQFGPWNRAEPAATPIEGDYTFAADLGTIKGIAGKLDSTGEFAGVIDNIVTTGTTTTPDFSIPKLKAAALPLETRFSALVDGTNGDVQLQSVDFVLGKSAMHASGFIVGTKGIKGKRVLLDVTSTDARMEDMLALTVRTTPPPITGRVTLATAFDLPRGEGDVLDRLLLSGRVDIADANFTSDTVQDKVDELSRRGRGRPKDEGIEGVPSAIAAEFALADGVLTVRNLGYRVAGATIAMNGEYALESGALDFAGTARLTASASDTQTGWKHFLLKPFDALFRKGGAGTRLAIRVSGSVDKPDIGLDVGRTLKGK